jgi:hypothetical protein
MEGRTGSWIRYRGVGTVKKVIENKWCDVCGKEMIKDGPIWYGGTVTIKEDYAGMGGFPHDEVTKDVCRECLKVIREYLKIFQFPGTTLSEEDKEMIDRIVSNIRRYG